MRDVKPRNNTGLNFNQTKKALRDGHKVTRPEWGGWLTFSRGMIIANLPDGRTHEPFKPSRADKLATDWKIL